MGLRKLVKIFGRDYDIVPSVFDSIDHHHHTNWQPKKMFFLLFLANIIPMVSLINCSLFQSRFFIIVNHIISSCCSVEEYMPPDLSPKFTISSPSEHITFFQSSHPFYVKGKSRS